MKGKYRFLSILLISFLGYTQDTKLNLRDSTCVQRDVSDILREAFHHPQKTTSNTEKSVILIPTIGSNPATGFKLGLGSQFAFKIPGVKTRYSMMSASAQFTTKNQQLYLIKNNIYTKNNNIFLTGDWRYLKFSQSTYGLGTNAPEGGILDYQVSVGDAETSIDSLAQPLKFNFLRIHQSISFRLKKSLYLGVGYYLDSYSNIKDEKLKISPTDSIITSHYAYSEYYNFDKEKYFSSGIGVNVIYDTRDNMINPKSGYYAMLSWNGSLEILGSDKYANFFSMEWRSFHPISQKDPRHILAFWLMADLVPTGELPYLILPATGYDQRSRSGRGYTQGRFRGNQLVYGETEYRFPISPCGGLWGGVLFVNATSANNPLQYLDLLESIKPGYGFGLRLLVDKKSQTNLAIDFGFGEQSMGFYLSATETF